jgi:signal transduction histidine kinase
MERAGWSAALEVMLRAIMHDLRNPVQAVLLAARVMEGDVPPERRRRYCGILARESERIGTIVDSLGSVLATSATQPEPVSVADVMAQLGHRHGTTGATVTVDGAGDVPPVRIVRRDLEQALLAVLTNARQAMAERGTGTIAVEVAGRGPYVTVTIVDSGPGIPNERRRRVFEPFFTTRAETGALGLGLPAARLLLARHGGRIAVLPPLAGAGARVRLQLPAWTGQAQAAPAARRPAARQAVPGGRRAARA